MAGFNAGSILEPLDYDFTWLAGHPNYIKELADAKGVIKEPTRLQVQAYMRDSAKEMQRLRKEAAAAAGGDGEPADADPDADLMDIVLAAWADADQKKADAFRRRHAALVSKLCSGEPSTAVLLLLPHRFMKAFEEWLVEEVVNPEAGTGGGQPHLRMIQSPAAG